VLGPRFISSTAGCDGDGGGGGSDRTEVEPFSKKSSSNANVTYLVELVEQVLSGR